MKLYEEFKEYETMWSLKEGHWPDGTYIPPYRDDIAEENKCSIMLPYQKDVIIFDLYNENEVDDIITKCAKLLIRFGNRARPGTNPRRSADELEIIKEECREAYDKVADQLKANAKMLAKDKNKFLKENDRFFATRKFCGNDGRKKQADVIQTIRGETMYWANMVGNKFEDGKVIFSPYFSLSYSMYKKATGFDVI